MFNQKALLTTVGLCKELLLQAKHGRGLEKACSMALGRVSIHCLQHQARFLLEEINDMECAERLLPFGSSWLLVPAPCPLLHVFQGELSLEFPLPPLLFMQSVPTALGHLCPAGHLHPSGML